MIHHWLKRYADPQLEVTPLLEARLAVRRRSSLLQLGAVVVVIAGALGHWVWLHATDEPAVAPVAIVAAAYLLLQGPWLAAAWYEDRADRRIAESMGLPLTPIIEIRPATVTDRQYETMAMLSYSSGVLHGSLGAAVGQSTQGWLRGGGLVVALVLLAASAKAQRTRLCRRPAVGADEQSLRVDEVVRHFDMFRFRLVVVASPVVLAVALMSTTRAGSFFNLYTGLAIAALVGELRAFTLRPRARVLLPGA